MSRDPLVYLEDILTAIDNIQEYSSGLTHAALSGDRLRFDAIIRNFQVIGEAAKKVPDAIKLSAPDIPWRKISGLRDILVHEYFNVNTMLIWDIIKNELPPLKQQVLRLKSEL
jgi:uncharacterized protein with HEPN domain